MGVAEEQSVAEQMPLIEKAAPVAAPLRVESDAKSPWSTGLCNCCAQPGGGALGCVSLCMPFVQYGVLAEHLPRNSTWVANSFCNAACSFLCLDFAASMVNCIIWPGVSLLPTSALLHMEMRRHLRTKYGIKGSWLSDLCTAWWCGPCALAQETREVIIRAQRQQQLQGAAAPPEQHQPAALLFGNLTLNPHPTHMAPPPTASMAAPAAPAAIYNPSHPHPGMAPATGVPVPYPAVVPPTHVATVSLPAPKDTAAPAISN